jgi:hypothetical protein
MALHVILAGEVLAAPGAVGDLADGPAGLSWLLLSSFSSFGS